MHKETKIILDVLRQVLSSSAVGTQEDIRQALKEKGYEVNQSKISRMLRKINAVKTSNELGQVVYHLPFEPAPPPTASPLSSLIIDVVSNEQLIVVYTIPGGAQVIARLIDHQRNRLGLLGSIAGDDTILAIPKTIENIEEIVQNIKQVLSM